MECDIKLYETAVVVAPKSAEIIRIPYSFIESCHLADYKITIKSHLGEILQITRMGFHFDPFMVKLDQAMEALIQKMSGLLEECTCNGSGRNGRRKSDLFLQLDTDAYRKYRFAAENIPELQNLRKRYIRRVMHTDKWEQNVDKILKGQ